MTNNTIDPAELPRLLKLASERERARITRLGAWEYLRFTGKFKSLPEGTAAFGDTVIWSYPKIGRIFQLKTGLATQLDAPFWIEEKIDGYNVRIFRHGDDILALTRRGYICPFTTDRLTDFINPAVFAEHPDLVLCAEVAGPGNPYNEGGPPFIPADVQFFIFDVMRRSQPGFLPQQERLRLLEEFGLPGVPQFGNRRLADWEDIRALIMKLNREGREGLIFKEDSPRNRRVKYVTGNSNLIDIRVSDASIQQLPAEYFMHRILRLVIFLEEHGIEPTPELCQELGQSLLSGALDTVRQFRNHHKVFHTFQCRFRQQANAELLMQTLGQRLGSGQVRQQRLAKEGDYYVLEFTKVLPRTTGLLGHLLEGGVVFD